MPKKVTRFEAYQISVDTKPNDATDIKCGGPHILGFDFFIDTTFTKNAALEMIRKIFIEEGHSDVSVRIVGKVAVKKLWTTTMIRTEIIRNPEMF